MRLDLQGTIVGGQSNLVTDDAYNFVRFGVVICEPGTTISAFNLNSLADPRAHQGVIKWVHDETIPLCVRGLDSTGYVPNPVVLKKTFQINQDLTYYNATTGISGRTVLFYMVSDSAAASHPGFTSGLLTGWFVDN